MAWDMGGSKRASTLGCRLVFRMALGFLVLGLWGVLAITEAPAAPCPASGAETARIAAVEARLEVRLDDGRLLRLAGLDPAGQTPNDPELGDRAHDRLAVQLVGKTVTLRVLAGTPDRWGRIAAQVFLNNAVPADALGGVAAMAIGEGFGRYLAEPGAHDCRAAFVGAEQTARGAKLGLWGDPYYAVMAVDDRAGFTERSATIVLVEGRLTAVQAGLYRTTLRFAAPPAKAPLQAGSGSRGGHMLVATILPHVKKMFEAQKVDIQALVGKHLRVRGLLDLRFGPQVDLADPDALEIVDVDTPETVARPETVVMPSAAAPSTSSPAK